MSLSDSIADMLTRIRNAVRNNSERVDCRNSNVCTGNGCTYKVGIQGDRSLVQHT